jgi:hypothetical protein
MMMNHPVIVLIAYNRPEALSRLLGSVLMADYSQFKDVSLIISIDGGGDRNEEVCKVADQVTWQHGKKQIIRHSENLGLRKHVISCGDLSGEYGSVIILEEDIYVSRNYYDYATKAINFYAEDEKIAGISLYSYSYFESAGIPFSYLFDGNDVCFMQVPSSWGEVWTKKQWSNFKNYYAQKPEIKEEDKLPEKVKTWPESSWKKYFYKYMVEKDLFFVYPLVAFSTNFGDVGTHYLSQTQSCQVELECFPNLEGYKFVSFSSSNNKYDAYFELLASSLIAFGVDIDEDSCVDLMGYKPLNLFDNKYTLSTKKCNKLIDGYEFAMIPLAMNVIHKIKGDFISYSTTESFGSLNEAKRIELISRSQSTSFYSGKVSVLSTKTYKLGYYLLHPFEIGKMLLRKFKR